MLVRPGYQILLLVLESICLTILGFASFTINKVLHLLEIVSNC
jgi:hypothetical protein